MRPVQIGESSNDVLTISASLLDLLASFVPNCSRLSLGCSALESGLSWPMTPVSWASLAAGIESRVVYAVTLSPP
jgi:hypothetical protein